MTGWVTEVNALPARIPAHSALDLDAAFLETQFPRGKRLGGDGECQVHGPLPIMRWDPPIRCVHARDRSAAPKEEQDGRLTRIHRYQARTFIEYAKAKEVTIESDDRVEIVCVKSGLQDARDDRHTNPPCSLTVRDDSRCGAPEQPA